jgi:hypothetical protein
MGGVQVELDQDLVDLENAESSREEIIKNKVDSALERA